MNKKIYLRLFSLFLIISLLVNIPVISYAKPKIKLNKTSVTFKPVTLPSVETTAISSSSLPQVTESIFEIPNIFKVWLSPAFNPNPTPDYDNVVTEYGSVSGNITYFYNDFRGNVSDTGAQVILIPLDNERTAKNMPTLNSYVVWQLSTLNRVYYV